MMSVVFMLLVQCSTSKEVPEQTNVEDRIRQLAPGDINSYHAPVKMEVAWVPYTEYSLEWTRKNEWRVVKNAETDTSSTLPMMLLTYPGESDTIWLGMNTDNETLGRLLKHTLMTQKPITRPFTEYVQIAKCSECHPKNIEIPFQ